MNSEKKCVVYLVGNKIDLENDREITKEEEISSILFSWQRYCEKQKHAYNRILILHGDLDICLSSLLVNLNNIVNYYCPHFPFT